MARDWKGRLGELLLAGLGILLRLSPLILFCLLVLVFMDSPRPDVSDLRYEPKPLPPEKNAYELLARAADLTEPLREDRGDGRLLRDLLRGRPWDLRRAEDLLERYGEALNLFDEALEVGEVRTPPDFTFPPMESFDVVSRWDVLRKLALVRVQATVQRGRPLAAIDRALDIVWFGLMVQRSGGDTIRYIAGLDWQNSGLAAVRAIVSNHPLSTQVLAQTIDDLSELKPDDDALCDSLRAAFQGYVQQIREGPWGMDEEEVRRLKRTSLGRMIYKPNKSIRALAKVYREALANVPRTYAQMDFSVAERYGFKPEDSTWDFLKGIPNMLGGMYAEMEATTMPYMLAYKCETAASVEATRVLLALKAYKTERGRLPDSLEELVPQYLDAVPADPFDGRPLRYSREKRRIWSVGRDLTDEGGLPEGASTGRSYGEEPTWYIEF